MKVSNWIKARPAQPVTVHPDEPIEKVAAIFLSHPELRDLYVISTEGRILGNLRHRRLAQILLADHLAIQSRHQIMERISGGVVGDFMEKDFVSAHPEEELDNVLNRMLEYEVEDMPILDDDSRIIGNINLNDVLHAVQQDEL